MRQARIVLPDLRDHANDRRHSAIITPDEIRALEDSRLSMRTKFGMIAGAGVIGAAVLTSTDAILLAGSIQIIDFQHAAILLFVLGGYPVPDTFGPLDKAVAA